MDGNRDLCEKRGTGRPEGSAMKGERTGRGGWCKQHKEDKGEESGLPFERRSTLHPLMHDHCYRYRREQRERGREGSTWI